MLRQDNILLGQKDEIGRLWLTQYSEYMLSVKIFCPDIIFRIYTLARVRPNATQRRKKIFHGQIGTDIGVEGTPGIQQKQHMY